MSKQFTTESGGAVGIYRKKDTYSLWVSDGQGDHCLVQLTKDELYRLIYNADSERRRAAQRRNQ